MVEEHWINEEFKDLNLGDKRLTNRFLKTMKTFNLRPDGCINRIFKDEAYESEWDKESERWVELLEDAETTYSENTEMVFIADREADQFQILYDCHNRGHSFVIRSKHDRMIQGEDHYLSWHLNKKKVLWDIVMYIIRRLRHLFYLIDKFCFVM